jgi:hypothetical protein
VAPAIVVGCSKSNDGPCSGPNGFCDPQPITGSTIHLANNQMRIAWIETSGCEVAWSGAAMSASTWRPASATACHSTPLDAAPATCIHYPCAPQVDGGHDCTAAWINTGMASCSVAVSATTGETQTFEVTVTVSPTREYCRTGTGECVSFTNSRASPDSVTLTFRPQAAPTDAPGTTATDVGLDTPWTDEPDAGADAPGTRG